MSILKKTFREPLVYFLLLAVMLITVESSVQQSELEQALQVKVTESDVLIMKQRWKKMYFRAPTNQELDGLIKQHIKEEVFYREAIKMGLAENDSAIRNRLYQKLSFLAEGIVEQELPKDEQLQLFYLKHKDKFLPEKRYSVRLKKLKASWLNQQTQDDLPSIIKSLSHQSNDQENKDIFAASMLPEKLEDLTIQALEHRLSSSIIPEIIAAPVKEWTGPILLQGSHYLLMVEGKEQPQIPEFSQIETKVLNEYIYQQRQQAEDTLYQDLSADYQIEVEIP
ncbi:MAG: peptidylprolyl isomerase [Colwellia sp.]|nr:peptidylprolyl isomerase [Colwellia sp.]MCW8863885.1 peptidylprolyl isomerase [Colwellia sp.]MCW9081167.1 peptidylprolyl isomerase [Colwellia sp.]